MGDKLISSFFPEKQKKELSHLWTILDNSCVVTYFMVQNIFVIFKDNQ